jgi:hypothetical protein
MGSGDPAHTGRDRLRLGRNASEQERHRLDVEVSARTDGRFSTNLYRVEVRNETADTVTFESVAIDPLNTSDVDVRDNYQAVNVVLEPARGTNIEVWIMITPRSRQHKLRQRARDAVVPHGR